MADKEYSGCFLFFPRRLAFETLPDGLPAGLAANRHSCVGFELVDKHV